MSNTAKGNSDVKQIIAQLGQVYADILGGMRGPEQLSRWLSEDTYLIVANQHCLENRARARKRQSNQREFFRVTRAEIFPAPRNTIEAVVLVKSSKTVQAISMRLNRVYSRWRVTHIELI
mgnify:FL=1